MKQLVRNTVEPDRYLGHVDRDHNGKKARSSADPDSSSMSTGQSSTEQAKESNQGCCQTMSSTNTSKASKDGHERTVPVDADVAVASSAGSGDHGNQGKRKEKNLGEVEACEDCR